MNQAARWIVIGDLHDKLDRLQYIPNLSEAAGVIITGDLTKIGGRVEARRIVEAIREYNPIVLAQFGNLDRQEVDEYLDEIDINLHCKLREISSEIAIIGVGGSIFTPFGTPSEFPEARFAEWLEALHKDSRKYKKVILVSHNPPYNTKCDLVDNGMHAGSRALREFIEETQPNVCLCGHIHEAKSIDRLGRTIVVNPGAFVSGTYAELLINEQQDFELSLYTV